MVGFLLFIFKQVAQSLSVALEAKSLERRFASHACIRNMPKLQSKEFRSCLHFFTLDI